MARRAEAVARCGGVNATSREAACGDVRVGFSAVDGAAPDAFWGLPVVCLEVSVVAPWVSNAPEPRVACS